MAAGAPAAIVVLGDKSSEWWQDDCAAATENLLLAAANLGLGAVWCGIKESQAPAVRKILNIPATEKSFASFLSAIRPNLPSTHKVSPR